MFLIANYDLKFVSIKFLKYVYNRNIFDDQSEIFVCYNLLKYVMYIVIQEFIKKYVCRWLFPYKKTKFRQPTRKKAAIINQDNHILYRLERESLNVADGVFTQLFENEQLQAKCRQFLGKKPAKVLYKQKFIYNWSGSEQLPRKLIKQIMMLRIQTMNHDEADILFSTMNFFLLAYDGVADSKLTFQEHIDSQLSQYSGPDPTSEEEIQKYLNEFKMEYQMRKQAKNTSNNFTISKNIPSKIISKVNKAKDLGRTIPSYLAEPERFIDCADDITMEDAKKSLPPILTPKKRKKKKKKIQDSSDSC